MKMLKRLGLFILILFCYLILREMLNFYVLAYTANPYLGYTVLFMLMVVLSYFVLIPVYKISRLSGDPGPVRKRKKELELVEMRLQRALKNPYLKKISFKQPKFGSALERYEQTTAELAKRTEEIRRKYIVHLFYSSAVSQYGFIDAILIFSANVNLVKEIFTIYTGRASGRDLWQIMKQIYYSVAIGGSEGMEFAVEELISKLGSDTLKSIPFFDKVMASIAGGFTNAVLLTRISYITENYCRMTYIGSTKDLSPEPKLILDATRAIVDEPIRYIKRQLNDIARQKALDFSKYAINPTRTVIEKAIDKFTPRQADSEREKKSVLRSIAVGVNPLTYLTRHRKRKGK
ncbi:MAG: YcjF family protein [Candidatus Marinimicrobia bacterium]|nr:YcjF family protein [Candidatus Neomarinimicrobiota bacterium]